MSISQKEMPIFFQIMQKDFFVETFSNFSVFVKFDFFNAINWSLCIKLPSVFFVIQHISSYSLFWRMMKQEKKERHYHWKGQIGRNYNAISTEVHYTMLFFHHLNLKWRISYYDNVKLANNKIHHHVFLHKKCLWILI